MCLKDFINDSAYRLFMCQDENENQPEDESFHSFWIKPVTNEPGPQYNDTLNALVFIFVFALAREQAKNIFAFLLLTERVL